MDDNRETTEGQEGQGESRSLRIACEHAARIRKEQGEQPNTEPVRIRRSLLLRTAEGRHVRRQQGRRVRLEEYPAWQSVTIDAASAQILGYWLKHSINGILRDAHKNEAQASFGSGETVPMSRVTVSDAGLNHFMEEIEGLGMPFLLEFLFMPIIWLAEKVRRWLTLHLGGALGIPAQCEYDVYLDEDRIYGGLRISEAQDGNNLPAITPIQLGEIHLAQYRNHGVTVYWRLKPPYGDAFAGWLKRIYGVDAVAAKAADVPQTQRKTRPEREAYVWAEAQELSGVSRKDMLQEFEERYLAEVGEPLANPWDSLNKELKKRAKRRAE